MNNDGPTRARPTRDFIRLKNLTVRCIIGVYPDERNRPQPLRADIVLHFDAHAAAKGGLGASIDYAKVSAEVRFLFESCHFLLLETAAEALAAYLLAPPCVDTPRAQVLAVDITLEKPQALSGVIPSLTIRRTRDDFTMALEKKPFGEVDVVYETNDCGIYRLRIFPGRSIPTHIHRVMHEREMTLSSGLKLQNVPQPAGGVVSWPHNLPHRYDNPTDIARTILCVDRPKFMPGDEIEVDDEVGPVDVLRYYPAQA